MDILLVLEILRVILLPSTLCPSTSEDKDILLSQISLLESSMREGSNGILAGPTFKWFTITVQDEDVSCAMLNSSFTCGK